MTTAKKKVRSFHPFLTASKYCGSGLKIDLVVLAVVVVVILVLVIKLLSNSTAFVGFEDKLNILCDGKIFCAMEKYFVHWKNILRIGKIF